MSQGPGRAPDRVVPDVLDEESSARKAPPIQARVAGWVKSEAGRRTHGSTRLLAVVLGSYFHRETEVHEVSVAELARESVQSVRTVQYGLRALCAEEGTDDATKPFLVEPAPPNGKRAFNRYRLNPAVMGAARCMGATGCTGATTRRDGCNPVSGWVQPVAYNRQETDPGNGSRNTPPTPRTRAGGAALERAIGTGKQLVVMAELEALQVNAGGLADRAWRKRAREALRTNGVRRGAQLVRERIDRETAARASTATEAQERSDADAAALALLDRARARGRPAGALWPRFLEAVEAEVAPHAFATWFRALSPVAIVPDGNGERLVVAAPNDAFCSWIARNYREAVDKALRGLGEELGLELLVDPGESAAASRAG